MFLKSETKTDRKLAVKITLQHKLPSAFCEKGKIARKLSSAFCEKGKIARKKFLGLERDIFRFAVF